MQSTKAINEARRTIDRLVQPLGDISRLIHMNLSKIQKHKEKINIENMTLEELRNSMELPLYDLEVVKLKEPSTVCTALTCTEVYEVR